MMKKEKEKEKERDLGFLPEDELIVVGLEPDLLNGHAVLLGQDVVRLVARPDGLAEKGILGLVMLNDGEGVSCSRMREREVQGEEGGKHRDLSEDTDKDKEKCEQGWQ